MVYLTNISKNNNTISANMLPEKGEDQGFISVDTSTGEIIEFKKINGSISSPYVYKAAKALRQFAEMNPVPTEGTYMWY